MDVLIPSYNVSGFCHVYMLVGGKYPEMLNLLD